MDGLRDYTLSIDAPKSTTDEIVFTLVYRRGPECWAYTYCAGEVYYQSSYRDENGWQYGELEPVISTGARKDVVEELSRRLHAQLPYFASNQDARKEWRS